MPTSILSQTILVETLLQSHTLRPIHYYGGTSAVTADSQEQRSPYFCDACTPTTARDICPENNIWSVYHASFVQLECYMSIVTYTDIFTLFFTWHLHIVPMRAFVTKCFFLFIQLFFCAFECQTRSLAIANIPRDCCIILKSVSS